MKLSVRLLAITSIASILVSSCSNKKASVLIPKDAAMVFHIDGASLSSKLPWSEIKNGEFFKMISEENEPDTEMERKLLEDPESSGIDLNNDFYIFMKMRNNHAYVVAEGKLKDAKKYEATLTSLAKGKDIKKDGMLNYAGNGEGCITWNDERFIIVTRTEMPQRRYSRYDEDDDDDKGRITVDSLLAFARDLYDLKENKSISSDARFSSLLKEKGDMHFLLNSNDFLRGSMKELSMLKASSLLEGNSTGVVVNFDNGKITASTKSWHNKELAALMKKYKPGNLDADMLKRLPTQDVTALIAMNYPPEGLKEFIQLLGVDGLLNAAMGQVNLSIDDFVKANKGDLMLAVSDFSMQEKEVKIDIGGGKTYSVHTSRPDANVLFAVSINNKESFTKLVNAVKKEMNKNGDGLSATGNIKYAMNDKWFVAGNKQEDVDNYLAGKNSSDNHLISQISGHPFGGFIDLQKIFRNIPADKADSTEKKMFQVVSQTWDNILFYGGERKDDALVGHFEITMKDKNTSSLKQLYSFLSLAAKGQMERRKNFEYDFDRPDSVEIPDLIETPKVPEKEDN